MNIFYLDRDPKIAAEMHCDKHVVKMILESAQMMSTAHRVLDGDTYADENNLYKAQMFFFNNYLIYIFVRFHVLLLL